jgi:DNA-binding IclR family transcriptional regulator
MSAEGSQTLERGLRVLRALGDEPAGLSVSELAKTLGTHRAGIYRLLAPLAGERLVERAANGRYSLGAGLVELASRVRPRLQELAAPELRRLADELAATAALTIRDGHEAVVAAVAEPRNADVHLVYRTGLRHALDVAAPGVAMLAAAPPRRGERPAVREARKRGWAVTTGELLFGATGVAAPVVGAHGEAVAAVSAVWIEPRDERPAAVAVVAAARAISAALR